MVRAIALFCLLMLPFSAASAADQLVPGTPYYFDSFNPEQRPWAPGQHLNIEEVFKNYQYYEVVFDRDGDGVTVNHYIRGSRAGSEKYRVLPDGSLQEISQ